MDKKIEKNIDSNTTFMSVTTPRPNREGQGEGLVSVLLSILIPTYDYTCYQLVYSLHEQAEALGITYEIIVAEDGSKSPVSIIANHKIIDLTNCRHLIRKENVGRSAIRNILMDEAQGELFIMMDSDGKVVRDDFLKKYLDAAEDHDVVSGGVKCMDVCYNPHKQLRWKYEKQYEDAHGYIGEQFRSSCYLVTREVAEKVRFDERYNQYGFEDVQYGKDLAAAGYTIFGIDNPIEARDLDDNEDFLKKTEDALRSAHLFRNDIGKEVRIVNISEKIKFMKPFFALFFFLFKRLMRANLVSKNPNINIFQLYKLCYYSTLNDSNDKI